MKVLKLILVILWMFLIFNLSGETATNSTGTSSSFTSKILDIVTFNKITPEQKARIINEYEFIIRKSAHFCIYMILGLLVFIYLKDYNLDTKKLIIYSILVCFIYAISDEIQIGRAHV